MHHLMPILTPGFPTRCGVGGAAGEVVGVVVGVVVGAVGSAGAGLHPTGTPGDKTIN